MTLEMLCFSLTTYNAIQMIRIVIKFYAPSCHFLEANVGKVVSMVSRETEVWFSQSMLVVNCGECPAETVETAVPVHFRFP